MEIVMMDDQFRSLFTLDIFESLIWTERYIGYGNFEFYTPMNQNMFEVIDTIQRKKKDYLDCYVWTKETESAMIIEELQITTDVENGNHLTISGRGLESILDRRIVWKAMSISANIQDCLEELINDAIISPTVEERKIENFIFERSDNEYLKTLTIQLQCDAGSNLYDVILEVCDTYQIGFDVYLNSDNVFVFTLKYGDDRSYDQNKNPYVIFSPKYENIINSDYLESGTKLKNVSLVVGDDRWGFKNERTVEYAHMHVTGLSRKEMYTDATNIQFDKYYEQLKDDKETLESYQQDLAGYEQSLSEVTSKAEEETTQHNKNVQEYNRLIQEHQNRINSLNQRISYYNNKKTEYAGSLTEEQKASYNAREICKTEIDKYDKLIKECDDNINRCNDNLQNEANLTYDKIVLYEDEINANEAAKKDYQNKKNEAENNKRLQEQNLPRYEDELKKYEDMMSKYEDIVANDHKTLEEIGNEANEEILEYNSHMDEYNQLSTQYQALINRTSNSIKEYIRKIAEEESVLSELYANFLIQEAAFKFAENTYMKAFTSEIEATKMFVCGEDFFKGDIVQIVNEYGMEDKVRVSEIVRVQDTSGFNMYPTFQVVV